MWHEREAPRARGAYQEIAARLLSRLPRFPGSVLFASALNVALVRQLPADVRRALDRKNVSLRVTDAGVAFDFVFIEPWFRARTALTEPDLQISASARDFCRLALRRVDADTLFFSRRLLLEGDTDLGVLVKNTLDAIEWPAPGGRLRSSIPRSR